MTFIFTVSNNEVSIGNGTESSALEEGKSYSVETLVIPLTISDKPIKEISYGAFWGYNQIINIIIEARIKTIRANGIRECQNLKTIRFPSTLEEIGANAFDDCYSLSNISFEAPYSLKVIGNIAFNTCYNLREVFLPSTLMKIGQGSFADMQGNNLTIHYCGRRVFKRSIFDGNDSDKVIVPYGGVKTFGNIRTTYGDAHCLMLEKQLTCRCKRCNSFTNAVLVSLMILKY